MSDFDTEVTSRLQEAADAKWECEQLRRERDNARKVAKSYRESWSYCAVSEVIPLNEQEQTDSPWLNTGG